MIRRLGTTAKLVILVGTLPVVFLLIRQVPIDQWLFPYRVIHEIPIRDGQLVTRTKQHKASEKVFKTLETQRGEVLLEWSDSDFVRIDTIGAPGSNIDQIRIHLSDGTIHQFAKDGWKWTEKEPAPF